MLKKLKLYNFRIFSELNLTFNPGINILLGENGVGKTSVLEAVYFLNFTKSFKTSTDSDMLNHGSGHFQISAYWKQEKHAEAAGNYWKKTDQKKFFLDGENVPRFSGMVGSFPMIFHSPEDSRITKGSESDRRVYFDKFFSQFSGEYLKDLILFRRIMKNKNAYLKICCERKEFYPTKQLETYNEQLVPVMYRICCFRDDQIRHINEQLLEIYRDCFGSEISGSIAYKPSVFHRDPDRFKAAYLKKTRENAHREIAMKRCLYGPNLDRYGLLRNGISLKNFASQGEHKIWLICLKLAEGKQFMEQSGKEPVYLFDDLFAELDIHNSRTIIDKIKSKNQVLVTTTDLNDLYRHGYFDKSDAVHVIEIDKQ